MSIINIQSSDVLRGPRRRSLREYPVVSFTVVPDPKVNVRVYLLNEGLSKRTNIRINVK